MIVFKGTVRSEQSPTSSSPHGNVLGQGPLLPAMPAFVGEGGDGR